MPSTWVNAMGAGRFVHGAHESLIAQSVSGTGDAIAASRSATDWSGLELIHPDGSVARVRAFDHPDTDQPLGVAFDGRYLVWSETHSVYDWDDWTLWAWDSATGRVRELARSNTSGGNPVAGPMLLPALQHGMAAWSRGNADGTSTLYLTDLASGRSRIAATGHPSTPVFAHGLLIWPESAAPGALTDLRAANPVSLQRVALPPQLMAVHGPAWLNARGDRLVWTSTDYTALWTWAWDDPGPARPVVETGPVEHVGQPQITGAFIVWTGDAAMFAYDLRSNATTQLTHQYGLVAASRTTLAVSEQEEATKSAHPLLSLALVETATLPPLPRC